MGKKAITTLTFNELKKIIGVADRTLKNWKKQDVTIPVVKIGRMLHFDPVKFRDWLLANDRDDYALKLTTWLKSNVVKVPDKPVKRKKTSPKSKPGPKPAAKSAIIQAPLPVKNNGVFSFPFRFDRDAPVDIFRVKEMQGELLKKLVNDIDNSDLATLAALTKNLNSVAEGYRKLEESCIEIDTQLGNVIPVDEVRRYHGEMMTRIKTDLRAMPFAIADELSVMTDPETISLFLKKRIDDALRHLATEIKSDANKSGRARNK
jgi:hypothetical protein